VRKQQRLARGIVLVLVCTSVSGCASAHRQGAGTTTAPTSPSSAVASNTPQAVAVAFTQALYSHHMDAASAVVAPNSQSGFQVLASIISGKTNAARDIHPGTAKLAGTTGTVTILGTICSGTAGSTSPKCITNDDPTSSNPAFRVNVQEIAGRWYVSLPTQ